MKKAFLLILILSFSLQNLNAQNANEILDIFSKIKTELGLGESIENHTIPRELKELTQLNSTQFSLKLDSLINQSKEPDDSSLENLSKTEFSYNGEGRLIEHRSYSYNEALDIWINYQKITRNFETPNKFVIYVYYWDEQENNWTFSEKYDINYENENIIEEMGYYWEDTGWVQSSYILYEYDANGNIATLIEGEIEYGELIFEIKAESQYNVNGDVIESMVYYRESTNSDWILNLVSEDTYTYSGEYTTEHINVEYYYLYGEIDTVTWASLFTYDNNYNLIEKLYDFTDTGFEVPGSHTEKYEYSYDENNFRTEYIFSTSENNPTLLFKRRIVYEILNDNYVREILYDWNNSGQNWYAGAEFVLNHDLNYENDEVVFPDNYAGNYSERELKSKNIIINILIDVYSTDRLSNTIYFYSEFQAVPTDINDVTNTETVIYPNPSNGILNLEIENSLIRNAVFNLYSSDGKILLSKNMTNNTLDVSFLEEGIYFYSIKKKDEIIGSGKLIRK